MAGVGGKRRPHLKIAKCERAFELLLPGRGTGAGLPTQTDQFDNWGPESQGSRLFHLSSQSRFSGLARISRTVQ